LTPTTSKLQSYNNCLTTTAAGAWFSSQIKSLSPSLSLHIYWIIEFFFADLCARKELEFSEGA